VPGSVNTVRHAGDQVSSVSDVAKAAASVVLTEPGLTNIVALVEQGRAIYLGRLGCMVCRARLNQPTMAASVWLAALVAITTTPSG
jgi:magnesium-transporting ATPase (P-type)